ncbi:beta-galactosidase [Microbacterium sp. QXD-8]|uniref:Beta-galactosidase n=1 Tax=Microbacterium psychrotolerans TaxID=3068321 RepID=A0ABU0Z3E8_9MICO|nr:beta-galactosidase [Microbacterium sp. QXD-8]MDQ7879113.1 beta-galactosidase [Microbacterium sp. QXD-8]
MLRVDATRPGRDELRPAMANVEDRRRGLAVTSRSLLRNGRPWLPVSGELHYTRVPSERWTERLRLMRSGGVSVVSTYVPWLHHEPVRGQARFDGRFDVGAFVDAVRAEGLEIVLRIGPWVHGEMRNGGLPDWVQHAAVRHRTDDPAYLDLVREWFARIADALAGRCTPENVLAIQLDNELYDQPGHLATLKRLAREAGLSAPLWTATAWGGAQLPDPEVLPLWGGYGDGFWVDPGAPCDPTFRAHYFFSDTWDDPGIGADVRGADDASTTGRAELSPWFPAATCELGGGMATAYHRRPRPDARDIAAVAHAKLGSGSAWQGYYMYAGGTNPGPGLEETQATDYPNDMTRLSYDFHAPIGESGRAAPSHAALRRQHAFIEAFGERLAPLPSHLPDVRPAGVEDAETLRWAVRVDDGSGFLFIGWHQPHVPLPTCRGARFRVETAGGAVELPTAPVDIPAGTLARWPLGLELGGVTVDWATASALTVLPAATGDGAPTLVLIEDAGIPVELAHDGSTHRLTPGAAPLRIEEPQGAALDVLVLAADAADHVWVVDAAAGGRRLLVGAGEVTWDADGRVAVRASGAEPDLRDYRGGAWRDLEWEAADATAAQRSAVGSTSAPERGPQPERAASVPIRLVRPETMPSGDYGSRDGRQAAPHDAVLDAHAAVYRLDVPEAFDDDAVLRVQWAGDVAQLRVDGVTATDRFWDGSELVANLRDIGAGPATRVELRVLPLRTDSRVHLPADAAARLAASDRALCEVSAARIDERTLWTEKTPPSGNPEHVADDRKTRER